MRIWSFFFVSLSLLAKLNLLEDAGCLRVITVIPTAKGVTTFLAPAVWVVIMLVGQRPHIRLGKWGRNLLPPSANKRLWGSLPKAWEKVQAVVEFDFELGQFQTQEFSWPYWRSVEGSCLFGTSGWGRSSRWSPENCTRGGSIWVSLPVRRCADRSSIPGMPGQWRPGSDHRSDWFPRKLTNDDQWLNSMWV